MIYTITDVVCSEKLPGGYVVWKGLQGKTKGTPKKGSKTSTPASTTEQIIPIQQKIKLDPLPEGTIQIFEKKVLFKIDEKCMIAYGTIKVPKGFKVLSGGGGIPYVDNEIFMCSSVPVKLNGSNYYNGWSYKAVNVNAKPSKAKQTFFVRATAIYDPNDLLDIDLMSFPIQRHTLF